LLTVKSPSNSTNESYVTVKNVKICNKSKGSAEQT